MTETNKKTYTVNSPLYHDGVRYGAGDAIELSESDAASLGEVVSEGGEDLGKTAVTANPQPGVPAVNNPEGVLDEALLINLNTATEEEIASVKYLGKAAAKAIATARPYAEVNAAKPKNMSEEQWAEISGLFTV